MSGDLRTSIVIDYQNVHLTGHELFASTAVLPRHETLVDPLLFAGHLLRIRNERQREGMAHATGLTSPDSRHQLHYPAQLKGSSSSTC